MLAAIEGFEASHCDDRHLALTPPESNSLISDATWLGLLGGGGDAAAAIAAAALCDESSLVEDTALRWASGENELAVSPSPYATNGLTGALLPTEMLSAGFEDA